MKRTTWFVAPIAAILAVWLAVPAATSASPGPKPVKNVYLSASTYSVGESAGHVSIIVKRPSAATSFTVTLTTSDGTAVAGTDYTAVTAKVTFPRQLNNLGNAQQSVDVPILDNSVANQDRTFTVSLSRPSGGYSIADPSTATVTITNNDVPAAPANLTADVVGADEIDLAWDANADYVTGYKILRSATSGGPYTALGASTTTSYQDTGLGTGTYYYVVQAENPAGDSLNSNEAVATIVPAQTELIYGGGFESGIPWYSSPGAGGSITLDSSSPHSGLYDAVMTSDGTTHTYGTMQPSFWMPTSGTVTFTAWYKGALSGEDAGFIAVSDYTTSTWLFEQDVFGSVTDWTETTFVMDASTMPGHEIVILVGLNASGASSFSVDDISAAVS